MLGKMNKSLIFSYFPGMKHLSEKEKNPQEKCKSIANTQLFTPAFHAGSAFHAMLFYKPLEGM